MTNQNLVSDIRTFSYQFDPAKRLVAGYEPSWKDRIDRWYQLDENSFLLCEAVFEWSKSDSLAFDEFIFLSDGGSNLADAEFVATSPASPAKFVYTLSNIAPSVVSHLLGWSGPLVCFSVDMQDQTTLPRAIELAQKKSKAESKRTFILHSIARLNEQGYRVVNAYLVN